MCIPGARANPLPPVDQPPPDADYLMQGLKQLEKPELSMRKPLPKDPDFVPGGKRTFDERIMNAPLRGTPEYEEWKKKHGLPDRPDPER